MVQQRQALHPRPGSQPRQLRPCTSCHAVIEVDPDFSSTAVLCILPLGCLYFTYLIWATASISATRSDANDTVCNKGELWWILFTAVAVRQFSTPLLSFLRGSVSSCCSDGLVELMQQAM